jgi:hypothetical protein
MRGSVNAWVNVIAKSPADAVEPVSNLDVATVGTAAAGDDDILTLTYCACRNDGIGEGLAPRPRTAGGDDGDGDDGDGDDGDGDDGVGDEKRIRRCAPPALRRVHKGSLDGRALRAAR